MNNSRSLEHEMQRLLLIDWVPNHTRIRSGAMLFREYLRRMSLWSRALGVSDEWWFFDVATRMAKPLTIAPACVQRVREMLKGGGVDPFYIERACIWHLEWVLQCVAGSVACSDLPDPYEPLIRLFERGQQFGVEKGFITISGFGGIPIGRPEDHCNREALSTLDDAVLDSFDR